MDRLEGAAEAKAQEEALAKDMAATEEGLGLNMVVQRGNVWGIFQLFGDTGMSYFSPELPNRGNAYFDAITLQRVD